jgi:microcin C transport system permease protein
MTPFLSNDKPLLIVSPQGIFFPILKDYTEKEVGGELNLPPDYTDVELQDILHKRKAFVLWPPNPYGPHTVTWDSKALSPPSTQHLLGTDDQGRDVLARVLYGVRISLIFGISLACISVVLGLTLGGVQGYCGGRVDLFGQRFVEIWSSLPTLFILIILSSLVRPNLWWLIGIMMFFSWMGLSALVRAEFLRARTYDYVKAAHILGLPTFRIIRKHILPNAMIATITFIPFMLNHAIATLTSLDFLGFGLPTGSPSLGELLQQGKNNLNAPWLGVTAFLTLGTLLALATFIGEGLRDAFDPYQSKP